MKKYIISALITLLLVGCSAQKQTYTKNANGLIDVNIQIDGAAVPYYAPLYLAQEKGFFAEQGLNVNFYYASAAEIVKNVGSGNVEFGFPNADPVILGRANGVPVKIVHTTLQNGLGSVIFKDNSGIKDPRDLKGKTIAITSYGSPNYIQLKILLEQNGLTIDDVNIKIVGTGAIVNALVTEQVDAISFSMLRTYELRANGESVSEFRSNEFTTTYGNVVIVSDDFLNENPEIVDGFTAALNQSLAYIINGNLEEAVDIAIDNYAPNAKSGREKFVTIIEDAYVNGLWQSDDTAQYGFGYNNPERYTEFINNLYQFKLIKEPYDVYDLITPNGGPHE
ncbi:ABC transporter substrate-binding protein [Erysipelothrix sp. HDW6C]|uniref:ABC transporter substrate-binding protein n=1 Tax=Erysipelothrix sp. HDW6C TaxID=2714930 RepID=UPI0014096C25|nr:ABC transporter substrate-binding protein [Erysipelothrix sp. HDW6C]QIK69530.1 ABC transporter substrate-binding protein [Erysipelothrix sp. HDW6C]